MIPHHISKMILLDRWGIEPQYSILSQTRILSHPEENIKMIAIIPCRTQFVMVVRARVHPLLLLSLHVLYNGSDLFGPALALVMAIQQKFPGPFTREGSNVGSLPKNLQSWVCSLDWELYFGKMKSEIVSMDYSSVYIHSVTYLVIVIT